MTFSPKRKRWLIILGSILLLLILLVIFANHLISRKADTLIRNELSKIDSTQFSIDYDKIRVNIFNRAVKVHGISIKPSQASLENIRESRNAPLAFEVYLDRLKISSIGVMAAIKGEEIDVGTISLSDPRVTIYGKGNLLKHKGQGNGQANLFSSDTVVETPFKEVRLGSFEIDHARIAYIDLGGNDTSLMTKDLNILVDDIHVHHPEGDSLSHVLDLGEVNIRLEEHFMELPGGFYSLKADGLEISYHDGELSLDSMKLIPAYPIGQFSKTFGKQTDRFDVRSGNIKLSGIVFDSLLNKKFIADELVITNPFADICRDKGVARDMSIFPKLFQTSIAELPILVSIKSISTKNGHLAYKEIMKGAQHPGVVILDELNMNIVGLCNYPDSMKNGQSLDVDAKAKLMNSSPLQVYFHLPIGNHAEYFTFHGSAGSFPAEKLNSTLKNMIYVEATGGTVERMEFYAMAMNDTTAGRIEFIYSDLSMTVLKKKKEQEGIVKENKFFSFVARTAMHKNNPNEGKPVRIAKMSFVRDPNKGFFNYFWKTLQNGIIITLTPGKKNLVENMEWPDFKKDWRKVVLNDWKALQVKHEKKKEHKKKEKKKKK